MRARKLARLGYHPRSMSDSVTKHIRSYQAELFDAGELYSTTTARDNGISAVMKTAPDAPLVDNT